MSLKIIFLFALARHCSGGQANQIKFPTDNPIKNSAQLKGRELIQLWNSKICASTAVVSVMRTQRTERTGCTGTHQAFEQWQPIINNDSSPSISSSNRLTKQTVCLTESAVKQSNIQKSKHTNFIKNKNRSPPADNTVVKPAFRTANDLFG